MRAVLFRELGPASVLRVVNDHPRPVRKAGEVLVEVHAAAVNPVDYKMRRGEFPLASLIMAVPKVPGADVAGVVLEADAGSKFPPGTKVYSCTNGAKPWEPQGTYSELVTIPEHLVARMPSSLSFEQAAALPLAGLTAWQAVETASLRPGQRVLIHAGAGGVGSIAIQLAKARGWHVTTTCSRGNLAFVKEELGADEAVDYAEQRFEEVYRGNPFDGVIDAIGGDYEARSLAVLKRGGVYVSILASRWLQQYGKAGALALTLFALARGKVLHALGRGPRYHLIVLKASGAELEALGRSVDEGKVKPIIDRVLPLEQARDAHEYLEQEHVRGKVVLRVKD